MQNQDELAHTLLQKNEAIKVSKQNKLFKDLVFKTRELEVAIEELAFQNKEKEKRAAELIIANKELLFQNQEKEKRAAELVIANKELLFQNEEKEKRALELIIANKELLVYNYISNHDFQEPLRKIQIFSDKILRDEINNLSENGKDYFKRIQNSADRMRQLMEALLDYSHLNFTERNFKKTDLSAIVNIAIEQLKEIIETKKAKIIIENTVQINVIILQFIHLIQLILSNALKFSSIDNAPNIVISCHKIILKKTNELNIPLNKYFHHISIADNGIGFDNIYNEKIFSLFQKLENKEDYEGIGMGLAIVKKIVDIHYGFISAVSEKNKGTTINIFIPV